MTINTERLLLRPFKEEDASDVFEYLKEPMVNCFNSMKLNSLEEALKLMKERINEVDYMFAIVLKEENKVIGEIDAYPLDNGPEDKILDTFSPCWMLNKNYHKKGYAYEAAYAFFDYLFKEKNARRIYAYTEDYNISSQNLCKRLGMRQEGFYKEFISFVNDSNGNPIYENTLEFAILKKEWLNK